MTLKKYFYKSLRIFRSTGGRFKKRSADLKTDFFGRPVCREGASGAFNTLKGLEHLMTSADVLDAGRSRRDGRGGGRDYGYDGHTTFP